MIKLDSVQFVEAVHYVYSMRSLYALVGGKMVYKPFLSIDAQIELLRGRGVSTDSRTGWLLERESAERRLFDGFLEWYEHEYHRSFAPARSAPDDR